MENLASEQKRYTYKDYLKIDDGNRYELIHGKLYLKDEWGDMKMNKNSWIWLKQFKIIESVFNIVEIQIKYKLYNLKGEKNE